MANSSPFSKTKFHPIEQPYSYEATVPGFRMPDGNIVINFDPNTKHSMLVDIARILGAELVSVKGTWHFDPLKESAENEVTD